VLPLVLSACRHCRAQGMAQAVEMDRITICSIPSAIIMCPALCVGCLP
jgi:hypothetical protein